MQKETARQDWIDLTRLVAILIVMMNHAGLKVRGVNFWGGMFYVPVFFVLSGFFFKARRGTFLSSANKRAKRLLVPFFVSNLVLVLFGGVLGGWLFSQVGIEWGGILGQLGTAIVGAVVILWGASLLKK